MDDQLPEPARENRLEVELQSRTFPLDTDRRVFEGARRMCAEFTNEVLAEMVGASTDDESIIDHIHLAFEEKFAAAAREGCRAGIAARGLDQSDWPPLTADNY